DDVAGKRSVLGGRGAGVRVLDHNRLPGVVHRRCEIARPLEGGGHDTQIGVDIGEAIALPIDDEEGPVAAIVNSRNSDRSGNGSAELIQVVSQLLRVKVRLSVEPVI